MKIPCHLQKWKMALKFAWLGLVKQVRQTVSDPKEIIVFIVSGYT